MRRMSRLSSDDCRALLDLARRAISSAVIEKRIPDFPRLPRSPHGTRRRIRNTSSRRPTPRLRWPSGIPRSAWRKRSRAPPSTPPCTIPDFPRSSADEVGSLEIEISVLSPPEPIAPEAILSGHHGLLIVKGENRGLLLPQVATERQWSCAMVSRRDLRQGRSGARRLAGSFHSRFCVYC